MMPTNLLKIASCTRGEFVLSLTALKQEVVR